MSGCIKRCTDYSLTQVKSKEFVYTWKISNFKSLHPGKGNFTTNNKVCDDENAVWDVQLYADGYVETNSFSSIHYDGYLAVRVRFDRQSSSTDYPIYSLIIFIVDKNGEERELKREAHNDVFVAKLVSKAYVFDEQNGVLPNGDLTLRFKTYFTSEVIPKYIVYNKSNLGVFINFIRRNFTYFTSDIVYTPKLSSILEAKLSALGNLFNNEKFSDSKVVANGEEFYVYKGILASQSPVFAAMFEHDMRESNENTVYILDFDCVLVEVMLRFIYTGLVSNLEIMARDLLAISDKYELDQLKMMCEETLINQLNVETVTVLLILADRCAATTLRASALEFFVLNVKKIIRTTTYKADLNNILPLLPEILENLVL